MKFIRVFTPPSIALELTVAESREMGADLRARVRELYDEFVDDLKKKPVAALDKVRAFRK